MELLVFLSAELDYIKTILQVAVFHAYHHVLLANLFHYATPVHLELFFTVEVAWLIAPLGTMVLIVNV